LWRDIQFPIQLKFSIMLFVFTIFVFFSEYKYLVLIN
jgi:hypothetical protein